MHEVRGAETVMLNLVAACAYFLLIHFGVSGTRVRDGLVARLGAGRYRGAFVLASIIRGDAVSAVRALQQQGGKDLVIYGHGVLSQALLEHRLVSELKLWIHPLFVGAGPRLFREGTSNRLRLLTSKTLGTGVIVATYQPAAA